MLHYSPMNWTPPTLEKPQLILPILQHCPASQWQPITALSPIVSITVPPSFVSIWETSPHDNTDPKELNDRLYELGKMFSKLIITGQSHVKVREKDSPTDLVTDMDQGIEMLFRLWINHHYSDHKIIGEEGVKDPFTHDDVVWFIDPIDGTRNFVNGSKDVAIHLGAIYKGRPYASYVGKPFYNTHYKLGDTITSPSTPHFKNPLVIGSEFLSNREAESQLFNQLLIEFKAKPQRKMSIGISLLDTWQNNVSLFYKPRLKPWDGIAPLLLMESDPNTSIHIRYYPHTAQHYSDYSPLFPLSEKTLKNWSDICQENCRIGHIIVGHARYEKVFDEIAAKLFKRL